MDKMAWLLGQRKDWKKANEINFEGCASSARQAASRWCWLISKQAGISKRSGFGARNLKGRSQ